MRIDIISAVPALLDSPFNDSILKRAQNKGIVEVNIHNLRDYSSNNQKSIDDYAFGGGAGCRIRQGCLGFFSACFWAC